jgi:hypothetical protein
MENMQLLVLWTLATRRMYTTRLLSEMQRATKCLRRHGPISEQESLDKQY